MADVVIAQKDFYTQAPVDSPAVFDKLARFEHITFLSAAAISKVEISDDGATYVDITANTGLLNVTTAGVVIAINVCAKFWRVTSSGQQIRVMAH
jgi:hypothetical protein